MFKVNKLQLLLLTTSIVMSSSTYAVAYPKGTIALEPAMLGLGNYTFGYENTDSQINRVALNVFKAANGFIASEVEKFNIGYSAEIDYFLIDNLAVAFRISYIEDKPLSNHINLFPRAYQFNSRTNWAYSVGLNKFFEISNDKWFPYLGITVGYLFQDDTDAVVYSINADNRVTALLGNAVLEPSKTRLKTSLNIGIDYQFSLRWRLSLASGLSYLARPSASYEVIYDLPTSYQDNNRTLTIPFYVSIKNVIPPKC